MPGFFHQPLFPFWSLTHCVVLPWCLTAGVGGGGTRTPGASPLTASSPVLGNQLMSTCTLFSGGPVGEAVASSLLS